MNVSAHPSVLFALGAGLLTGLSPCVYPMIPITLAIFGVKAGTPRTRALVLASAYVAGIAVTFGALGTICGLTGSKFGAYLGSPWVVVPLALFFAAMGLSMFGAFEIALPSDLQQRLSRVGGRGFMGAFMMGLVGGIIAAPCTGPPLLALLAYVTTTRDAGWGFVTLATYGAGVGVPLWLLAAFSMSMPRPGAWMDWVKSFFGILLFLAVAVLPQERGAGAGPFHVALAPVRDRDGCDDRGRPRAGRDSQDVLRRRARAGAQGLRHRPGDGGAARRDQLRVHPQGRDPARLAVRTRRRRWPRRARRGGPCWSISPRTGARPARSWT